MGSSQKVFTLSLCLLLSSTVIIDAFGMLNNHRRSKGLEALLATGIIALLLRNHQLSKYASGGHGHGHGLQGINLGHGKGHTSNVGSLAHADNLKLLGNIHSVPGLSQAHNFHGIQHLPQLHGISGNIATAGQLPGFHGFSKNLADIGHIPEFHGLTKNIAGMGHLPEFYGNSKNIANIGHAPEFHALSGNMADLGHLTEFYGHHEDIPGLGNFENFPDIKKILNSAAREHGKNVKCVGQSKKLKVSGYEKLLPINIFAQKLTESDGDTLNFKDFGNIASLENAMQNNKFKGLKHKNNFVASVLDDNAESYVSNLNLADKIPFVGLKQNYNARNNMNGKFPTMHNEERSYSYEAYEHPDLSDVDHTSDTEEER